MAESDLDNRFYFDRKNVTEKIAIAFHGWERGEDVLTVLIGEKGTGKTSIQNYCEKNIFNSYIWNSWIGFKCSI